MNAKHSQILLCTNGKETTRPALRYGVWLAELLKMPVVLLGILEIEGRQSVLEALINDTARQLEASNVSCQKLIRRGRASVEISRQAASGGYITIVGPFGRSPLRRWLFGRTFRRLLAKVDTPILYVPVVRLPLKRMLMCMGGLGYTFSAEHILISLAQLTGASVTLLNVVEPVSLDYPVSREIKVHWSNLLETDTPQAHNLQQALNSAEEANIEVSLKVRYGTVVKEILDEVRTGDYDLIGLGSHYSSHSLRQQFLPNVTAEVAEAVSCPVLTVRSGYEVSIR